MHDQSMEVKVKSYNYAARNVGILCSVFFALIGIGVVILSESYTVMLYAICIFSLIAFGIILWVILSMVFCKHYDVYTPEGFRHEYKGTIIYEVKWENVKKLWYASSFLWNFIPHGANNVIDIDFISEIKFNDNCTASHHQHLLRPYCDYSVSNYINMRDMIKVIELIPGSVEKKYSKKLNRYIALQEQKNDIVR